MVVYFTVVLEIFHALKQIIARFQSLSCRIVLTMLFFILYYSFQYSYYRIYFAIFVVKFSISMSFAVLIANAGRYLKVAKFTLML